ncbi:MAG: UDP-N-acetylmuramoyl-L-alanyl-D-glutamate--2,6-diaminopimelate ligase [Anaerorhabdus sp.]
MKLNKLFKDAPEIDILNIITDSRKKRKNSIFFCIKGMMNDGHRFISQAISNGAICVVYSDDLIEKNPDVTYVRVKDVQDVLNKVVDIFYDSPSKKLRVFGVTGTNGKSSVTMMIRNILNRYVPTGYIGTISVEYGEVKLPPSLTTPEPESLHAILKDMVDANIKACTLEVSSIGLEQHRTDSVDFDVAIFTNLTHDHLDYHGTMENYFLSKKKFFDNLSSNALAVTNVDNDYGTTIVEDTEAIIKTYGIYNDADYMAKDIKVLKDKTVFKLVCKERTIDIETNLVAEFNIYNLLATIVALHWCDISLETIALEVKNMVQIEGRMERVNVGQPFNVLVDFAHTPDGIEQVMRYAVKITPKENRIIAVLGSAGKRDFKKRPIFGELVDKYCDMIILTEDDPRDESVVDICNEIASGIKNTNFIIIERRYDAIRQAVELANSNDTILLLGKGDENFLYRDFGRETYLGDNVVASEVIEKYYFNESKEEE